MDFSSFDERLFRNLLPLACGISRKYQRIYRHIDRDTFDSAAYEGLATAICEYRQGAKTLRSYVFQVVECRMIDVVRTTSGRRGYSTCGNRSGRSVIATRFYTQDGRLIEPQSPPDSVQRDIERDELIDWLSSGLTDSGKIMLRMRLDGYSMAEIAQVIGRHESLISLRLREMAEALAQRFNCMQNKQRIADALGKNLGQSR